MKRTSISPCRNGLVLSLIIFMSQLLVCTHSGAFPATAIPAPTGTIPPGHCNTTTGQCDIRSGTGRICTNNEPCVAKRCMGKGVCVPGGFGRGCNVGADCPDEKPHCAADGRCIVGGLGAECTPPPPGQPSDCPIKACYKIESRDVDGNPVTTWKCLPVDPTNPSSLSCDDTQCKNGPTNRCVRLAAGGVKCMDPTQTHDGDIIGSSCFTESECGGRTCSIEDDLPPGSPSCAPGVNGGVPCNGELDCQKDRCSIGMIIGPDNPFPVCRGAGNGPICNPESPNCGQHNECRVVNNMWKCVSVVGFGNNYCFTDQKCQSDHQGGDTTITPVPSPMPMYSLKLDSIEAENIKYTPEQIQTILGKVQNRVEIGRADATIEIAMFYDAKCGMCAKAWREIVNTAVKDYVQTGKAKMVFMSFPLGGDSVSATLSQGVQCAARQGKGFEFLAYLHEHMKDSKPEEMKNYARITGIDVSSFALCLKDPTSKEEVRKSSDLAVEFGIVGTPHFFINGKSAPGAMPYDKFRSYVEPSY